MEIIVSKCFSYNFSSTFLLPLTAVVTAVCCVSATFFTLRSKSKPKSFVGGGGGGEILVPSKVCNCGCACSCKAVRENSGYLDGGNCFVCELNQSASCCEGDMVEKMALVLVERQTGASMMEQLVPEITTHALSYLDYPSLCRLSMTNSLMRKAANDDSAWKALYHKDFTLEQDSVTPVDGWKAYYAVTRAIINVNNEFFCIIRERSLAEMGRFWLNAEYVKCFHASGEFFTGYSAVMQSWQLIFNWEQGVDFNIEDVRTRVVTDVAWVTMKAYVDIETGPLIMTNVFEFHNGSWHIVHHHSSVMQTNGGAEQMVQG